MWPQTSHFVPTVKRLSSENEKSEEESCRARTRNYDEDLKQEQLTKARTQIGTQVLQDSDLARVVMAWSILAPALKAAVLALISSTRP